MPQSRPTSPAIVPPRPSRAMAKRPMPAASRPAAVRIFTGSSRPTPKVVSRGVSVAHPMSATPPTPMPKAAAEVVSGVTLIRREAGAARRIAEEL